MRPCHLYVLLSVISSTGVYSVVESLPVVYISSVYVGRDRRSNVFVFGIRRRTFLLKFSRSHCVLVISECFFLRFCPLYVLLRVISSTGVYSVVESLPVFYNKYCV